MWILVVGIMESIERLGGGFCQLRDLGCRVRGCDLRGSFQEPWLTEDPPSAVLFEAHEDVDMARAALARLRAEAPLAQIPALVAAPLASIARLDVMDGFDDFVLIPYIPQELYVRIRRAEWKRGEFVGEEVIKIGPLRIDLAAHDVLLDGRKVDLTRQEFALLGFLCRNRGRVFSREELLARVWGASHYRNSRTIDMHMRRLRTKLGACPVPLDTVRGVGYIMRAA